MNYLDFIYKYQNPSQPLLSTGDEEKDRNLIHAQELYAKDQPLSGTDPVGEFYVSGIIGEKTLKLIGSILNKLTSSIIKKPLNLQGAEQINILCLMDNGIWI